MSYYPLSLWPWQTAIKAIFLDRVDVIETYEREVHSPTIQMKIPSVIALKQYVKPSEYPAFTRFNLFLRDRFHCQYCGSPHQLTFDHVVPRRLGGKTTWQNVATACAPCNMRKGGRTPAQANMRLMVPRSARPAGNCRSAAGLSRRTICTIAGMIGCIGMSSWRLEGGRSPFIYSYWVGSGHPNEESRSLRYRIFAPPGTDAAIRSARLSPSALSRVRSLAAFVAAHTALAICSFKPVFPRLALQEAALAW